MIRVVNLIVYHSREGKKSKFNNRFRKLTVRGIFHLKLCLTLDFIDIDYFEV